MHDAGAVLVGDQDLNSPLGSLEEITARKVQLREFQNNPPGIMTQAQTYFSFSPLQFALFPLSSQEPPH